MSYVYNSGMGGVKCDGCRVLIDAELSYKEYAEIYLKQAVHMPDLCWRCVANAKTLQKKGKKLSSMQTT